MKILGYNRKAPCVPRTTKGVFILITIMIALADLSGLNQDEILNHLASEYSGTERYESPKVDEIDNNRKMLSEYDVLVAYESVGSWGCDSSSFFLLKNKTTGTLYEVNGSHCSCYGFEGQLDLEETSIEVLKNRALNGSVFYCGGYDDNETANQKAVKDFILTL